MPIQGRRHAFTLKEQMQEVQRIISRLSQYDRDFVMKFIYNVCSKGVQAYTELEENGRSSAISKIATFDKEYFIRIIKDMNLTNYS